MDQHGSWQRQKRRHHLPFPSGTAQVITRLSPVHEGGGVAPGRPHLQGQVRGVQAGAVRPPPHVEGVGGHRRGQADVHPGLEEGDSPGL